MTEFFLIAIAVLVVWAIVRSHVVESRSALGQADARMRRQEGQIQLLHERVSRLEKERAERLVADPGAVAGPVAAAAGSDEARPITGPEIRPEIRPEAGRADVAVAAAFVAPVQVGGVLPVAPVIPVAMAPAVEEPVAPKAQEPVAPEAPPPVAAIPHAGMAPARSAPPAKEHLSLEERLGSNWLSKIGIALVAIGVASFLAVRLTTMGPAGKVLTGFAVGFGLLLGATWLERRAPYRVIARAGIGGGWALIFFTTFAMHHLKPALVLQSLVADLVLMLMVAGGMVLHSLRYRSQTVTGLAFLLGYGTLVASHLQSADGTVFFSLGASAVLAVGLVVVTTLRHWARLELAGLLAVLANHFLWLSLVLPASGGAKHFPLFWPSTLLILFNWALFRMAYLLRTPLDAEEDRVSSLSAVVNAAGVLGLLKYQSSHPEWTFWALLAMGLLELALGLWARSRRRSAFVVLTTIATVLLVAAVPYRFHGVSWPVLWLVEAHVLALCGLRLGEPVFRRLGLLAGLGAGVVLAVRDVIPLILFRLDYPDGGRHGALTVGLGLAATLFWLHGEVYPRRWPEVVGHDLEALALTVTSGLGAAAAATALWVALPVEWVATGWLALVVLMGLAADWKAVGSVAIEADLLAGAAVAGLIGWDFSLAAEGAWELPSALGIALLYAGMRRRTVLDGLRSYVAAGYSWVASLLLLYWLWRVLPEHWVALAGVGLGLVLFEAGRGWRKGFLRWQGYVAAGMAGLLTQIHWTEHVFTLTARHGWFAVSAWDWSAALAVAATGYWLQERTRDRDVVRAAERWFGILAGATASLVVAFWLPLVVASWGASESTSIAWAVWAVVLSGVALVSGRGAFRVHGIAMAVAVFFYGSAVALASRLPSVAGAGMSWVEGDLFRLGLAAGLLLLGLVFAFRLRAQACPAVEWARLPGWMGSSAAHPEQWFFFAPFGLMVVTLAAVLRVGTITLGWSLLGLGAFVFALLVGERSFRLGGLALLLVSVVKILLMDVWTLSLSDRVTTLIVMGCALVLVSFLYTRFRVVFRRLL